MEDKCFTGTHTWIGSKCRDCRKSVPNFGDALKEVFKLQVELIKACKRIEELEKERDDISAACRIHERQQVLEERIRLSLQLALKEKNEALRRIYGDATTINEAEGIAAEAFSRAPYLKLVDALLMEHEEIKKHRSSLAHDHYYSKIIEAHDEVEKYKGK